MRCDQFPDLAHEVGTVRAIDRGRAHVLWDRRAMGVSWLLLDALIVV